MKSCFVDSFFSPNFFKVIGTFYVKNVIFSIASILVTNWNIYYTNGNH